MSRRRNTTGAERGFTLVELLIAIAVFAVMAAIAYGGLSSVISSRESIDAALERSKTLQMALWRIQQDIEQTVDRPVRDSFGDVQPAIYGSAGIGLYVTRAGWNNPLGARRSTLQRAHYDLDGDGHLVRSYFRVLDQAQDSEPVNQTLLSEVVQMEWRFLDANGQWQDRWPPDANAQAFAAPTINNNANGSNNGLGAQTPPQAIELTLDTRSWGQMRLLYMIPGARL